MFIGGGAGSVGRVGGGNFILANLPVLSSINNDGWSAEWIETPPTFQPDSAPFRQNITRAGFSETGEPTTYNDSVVIVSRVRTPRQVGSLSPLPLTPNTVAMSSYVYIDDNVDNVVNNSTFRSPKPIACHAIGHRDLFRQILTHEVVIGHRNAREGRQFVCATITVTDKDGLSITQTVSTQVVSNRIGDKAALEVAKFEVDTGNPATGGLANGPIKYDVKVFPWYGKHDDVYGNSSILDTAQNSLNDQTVSPFGIKGFTTRYAEKRFNGWPIAYLNNLGSASSATAGWTLDGSTENNNSLHFTTLRAAIDAFYSSANDSVTNGFTDPTTPLVGEIRVVPHSENGVYGLTGSGTARTGGTGALIITKDPRSADYLPKVWNQPGTVQVNMTNPTTGRIAAASLILRNITVVRSATGTGRIATTANNRLELWFDNVQYDVGGNGNEGVPVANSTSPLNNVTSNGGLVSGFITGMKVINSSYPGNPTDRFSVNSIQSELMGWMLVRGLDMDNAPAHMGSSSIGGDLSAYCLLASRVIGLRTLRFGNYGISNVSGAVMASNLFPKIWLGLVSPTFSYFDLVGSAGGNTADGVLLRNLLFENVTTSGDPCFRLSADAQAASTNHVIMEGILLPSVNSGLRMNAFYTDGPTPRTHTLNSLRGLYVGQFNFKSDIDTTGRTGNWSMLYGTDCYGTYTQYADAQNNGQQFGYFSFSQQYLGLGSSRGTLTNIFVNPGVENWKAVTFASGTPTNGEGDGNYATISLENGLRGRVELPYRKFDIEGNEVSIPDSTGPYA